MNIKIQCGCGAKYSLAIEPEQMEAGVSLVCQYCGADNSEALAQILQQQIARMGVLERAPVVEPVPVGAGPVARVADVPQIRPCLKHPGNFHMAECVVCRKPLCPKCLEAFGYVCSAYCKAKAEEAKIAVPKYSGQRAVVERRFWRSAKLGAWAIGGVAALLLGVWAWYSFVGSHPRVAWSVKMPRVDKGWCKIVAPGELLVCHGNRVARYDLAKGHKLWESAIGENKAASVDDSEFGRQPFRKVQWVGGSVWAVIAGELVQLDWATGKRVRSVSVPDRLERCEASEHALLLVTRDDLGRQTVMHVDGRSGELRSKRLPLPGASTDVPRLAANVAEEGGMVGIVPFESELVPAGENFVLFSVKLVETRITTHQGTAQPKGKSALENVSGANATAAILETLIELKEANKVRYEDESKYAVTLQRLPGEGGEDWTGEVIGPPSLYTLPTVDVLVAGKTIQIFDKANKKLWQGGLATSMGKSVAYRHDPFAEGEKIVPAGENGNRLYFFDPTVLTCFDLATGNALWRFQAGGISRLEFDREGMVYVTATRGGVGHLRDIDLRNFEKRSHPVILKLDPANGKPLWDLPRDVQACRPSGKFVYGLDASKGEPGTLVRRDTPEYMKLYRLENDTGMVRWECYDKRMPLSWDCQDNTIALLFQNELQILRFFSL